MMQKTFLFPLILLISAWQGGQTKTAFLIGNSLTYGTLPNQLDGEIDYHIQCNENLHQIATDPWVCVDDATLWTEALAENEYETIVVQVYKGTTLQQDFDAIKLFADLQPAADIVIFTGWPRHSVWESVYSAGPTNEIGQSKTYIWALLGALKGEYPDRDVVLSGHLTVLNSIREDANLADSALVEFENLFRDETHLSYEAGRYLSHNLMRAALDQPIREDAVKVEDGMRVYLNYFINAHHELSRRKYFLPIIWGSTWR